MDKVYIKYSNDAELELPVTVKDLVNKAREIRGYDFKELVFVDGDKEVKIPWGKLSLSSEKDESRNKVMILNSLTEIESIDSVETFNTILDNNEVIKLKDIGTALRAKKITFKPKQNGIYIGVLDTFNLPINFYSVNEFINFKQDLIDKFNINNGNSRFTDLDKIKVIIVEDDVDGSQLIGDVSTNLKLSSGNINNFYTKLEDLNDLYIEMNRLSKLKIIKDKLKVKFEQDNIENSNR